MNKIHLIFLMSFTLTLVFTGCDDDDDTMIDLPTIVDDYLADNYPNYSIDESEESTLCDGTAVYEVELENSNDDELELTFDTEGNFLFSENEIANSELPIAVTNSIATNYPDYSLEEGERLDMFDDTKQYVVEIEKENSELYVLMEADGTVICEDDDE